MVGWEKKVYVRFPSSYVIYSVQKCGKWTDYANSIKKIPVFVWKKILIFVQNKLIASDEKMSYICPKKAAIMHWNLSKTLLI